MLVFICYVLTSSCLFNKGISLSSVRDIFVSRLTCLDIVGQRLGDRRVFRGVFRGRIACLVCLIRACFIEWNNMRRVEIGILAI